MSESGNNPSNPQASQTGKPGSLRAGQALPLNAAENLIADLIEGQPTAEQLSKLDPKVRAQVESLRKDRAVLMGIPDQAAPAGLLDAVMSRLERESLFEDPFADQKLTPGVLLTAEQFGKQLEAQELAEREALVGSALDPHLAGKIGQPTFRTRGMVAAAALLLVGGGLYLASLTINPTPAGPGPLALNTHPAESETTPGETGVATPDKPNAGPTLAQNNTPNATNTASNTGPTANSPDAAPIRTLAQEPNKATDLKPVPQPEVAPVRVAMETGTVGPSGVSGTAIAAALAAADRSRVLDGPDAPARALQAAREGRLIIRVRSNAPETARARLASVVDERQPESRTWQLSRATQPEIIAAATRAVPTLAERVQAEQERLARARTMASDVSNSTQPTMELTPSKPAFDPRQNQGVFLLDVPASDDAISTARVVLAGVLLGRAPGLEPAADAIELVELDNAIPALPSTQVEAVMWWTQPPRNWIGHASVPVVIEEN